MDRPKMLVKLHHMLLKSIGLEYLQRKLQAVGFIWKMSLKYKFEVRKKKSVQRKVKSNTSRNYFACFLT